jgi:hypothetical protein
MQRANFSTIFRRLFAFCGVFPRFALHLRDIAAISNDLPTLTRCANPLRLLSAQSVVLSNRALTGALIRCHLYSPWSKP